MMTNMMIIKLEEDGNVDDHENRVSRHLEKVEDDQRQDAPLLQEEHVDDQPDGEQEEREAEDGKDEVF